MTIVVDEWVDRLTGDEPEEAIADLRMVLLQGLRKSFAKPYGGIDPEDFVQEALIKLLSSIDKFRGQSRFLTWAMTIATRVGIDHLRQKRFKDVSLDSMTQKENLVVEKNSSAIDSDKRDLLGILQTLIDSRLTNKQRQAIQGILDGLPIEEVARRTNNNRNATYKLIHDARMNLRKGFVELGFDADDFDLSNA